MSLKNYIRRGLQYAIHGVPTQHTTARITYTSPNQVLLNKKIIITGGGRGIGLAMAKKFVSEGASVLIAGRNEDTLKASAAEIGCQYLKLDVQDTSSFNVFVDRAFCVDKNVKAIESRHDEGVSYEPHRICG